MEKAMVDMRWLRQKMAEGAITQVALARETGIPQSALSAMLNGREYLGPKRAARIQAALLRLTVDRETATEPQTDQPAEPRVRRL